MNLFIFDKIIQDPIISALLQFKTTQSEDDYFTVARGLIEYSKERLTDKNIIREYVLRKMLALDLPDIANLRNFLRHDVKIIYTEFFETDWDKLFHEQGFIPMSDIECPPEDEGIDGFTVSISSMIDCESNEALGGALLAHVTEFVRG